MDMANRKSRFFGIVVLALLLCFSSVGSAQAADQVTVVIDGQTLVTDVPAQIINDRTFVPMRAIFEALGATVDWQEATQTVTSKKDDNTVRISIGSRSMVVNNQTIGLDVSPVKVNDRTLVPVRAVSEAFGYSVQWEEYAQRVVISSGAGSTTTPSQSTAGSGLSAVEVSALCSEGVFYIVVSDANGNAIRAGSGFFISSDGRAVTNYHVISGASSAVIRTVDGEVYSVSRVLGYDVDQDLAILQVNGTGFNALNVSNEALVAGQKLYCIGSPLGLENTITEGIVSNIRRVVDGTTYFQMSSAISNGSSGGAVLNDSGEVIGVSTAGFDDGQLLNLAIPASYISQVSLDTNQTLSQLFSSSSSGSVTVGDRPDVGELEFDEREPNDSMDTADLIVNGTTVTGYTSYYDDDVFKINVPANSHLIIILSSGSNTHNALVGLYDRNGNALAYKEGTYGENTVTIEYDIRTAGTYYILANTYSYSNVLYAMYVAYLS